MNKEERKKIKFLVKEYFEKEKLIDVYKNAIIDFENQIYSIEKSMQDLSCINFSSIDIRSPSFEQAINNSNYSSYFENNIVKKLEEREKLIEKLIEKIENYSTEIHKLQIENAFLTSILNLFSTELRKIIVARYQENKSAIEISLELCISHKKYYTDENRILETIYNIFQMNNMIKGEKYEVNNSRKA